MWVEFLRDLLEFKGKEFYVFSNQSWHYGWDYERRKNTYKRIFQEKINCVSLDLNNNLMVFIFKIFLKMKKIQNSFNQVDCKITDDKYEIFYRNFWDHDKNLKLFLPTNTSINYFRSYLKWCQINSSRIKKMIISGEYIFKTPTYRGLIVSQFGYEDWAWASLTLLNNRPVYSPEANFGFTKLSGPIEIQETNFIIKESKFLRYSALKKGLNSLFARCNGNFSDSAISYYMSDMEFNIENINLDNSCKYVFYLHAFGDSPNNTISNYLDTFGIDYFHSTLKLLEKFDERKISILIKLHPLSQQYNYDHSCLKIINDFVESSKFVNYCPDFPLKMFKFFLPNASIITGRGSIISEASFIGINSFSFCKSVYTELGMSIYFNHIDEVLSNNGLSKSELKLIRNWSVKLESVRLEKFGSSIYALSNYNRNSKLINHNDSLLGFLDSDRIVNL